MMNNKINVFTYGSLMNNKKRTFILNKYIEGIKDKLIDYDIKDHSMCNFPTIYPKKGKIVNGIVFKVDQLELMILDRYENNLYDKIEIKTQNNLNCLVYIEKNEALK